MQNLTKFSNEIISNFIYTIWSIKCKQKYLSKGGSMWWLLRLKPRMFTEEPRCRCVINCSGCKIVQPEVTADTGTPLGHTFTLCLYITVKHNILFLTYDTHITVFDDLTILHTEQLWTYTVPRFWAGLSIMCSTGNHQRGSMRRKAACSLRVHSHWQRLQSALKR